MRASLPRPARALFIPGGLYGSVHATLGPQPAKFAASALLADRLTLGPLAAVVAGHYAVAVGHAIAGSPSAGAAGDDAPSTIAAAHLRALIISWIERRARPEPLIERRAPNVGYCRWSIPVR